MGRQGGAVAVIVIVDRDPLEAQCLATALTAERFDAVVTDDTHSALDRIAHREPALVLLGLDLPGGGSTEVLRRLRRETHGVPVIAFSDRDNVVDPVLAFELGADDYIRRPLSPREIVLRIRAVLRRSSRRQSSVRRSVSTTGASVDLESRILQIHERQFDLTPLESRLATELITAAGSVLPRRTLLTRVWAETEVDRRAVDTHIRRLREKLGEYGRCIETVRGAGYRFRVDPAQSPLS